MIGIRKLVALRIILFLAGVILFTSCSRQIYGQRQRRIDRNCGCELVQPSEKDHLCLQ